jgi:demethoxyubiquinone hydroxylase (CLK1/Coq7/Cat5 family)
VSLMVSAVKEGERGTCSRIIKVNHAGEFGAVNIYRAQLMVARLTTDQIRLFEVNGNTLTLTTRARDPASDTEVHYAVVWQKVASPR